MVTSDECPLCHNCVGSVNHMFFDCQFSGQVWQKVLNLLHFFRNPDVFGDELQWVIKSCKRGGNKHKLLVMFFAESIYSLWLNMNDQVYNLHCKTPLEPFKEIQFRVQWQVEFLMSLTLIC